MEAKENQRVLLTKRLLLEALIALLEKKHINDISVTELCAAAGINRATFYKHYSTPNDILSEVGHRYAAEMMLVQEAAQKRGGARQAIEDSCVFMHENKEFVQLIIRNGMDSDVAMKALVRMVRQASSPYILNLRGADETERELLMAYVASGCYSLMKKWIMEELPKTPQEIASILYRLFTGSWIDWEQRSSLQE